jgi:hypothetical protein
LIASPQRLHHGILEPPFVIGVFRPCLLKKINMLSGYLLSGKDTEIQPAHDIP